MATDLFGNGRANTATNRIKLTTKIDKALLERSKTFSKDNGMHLNILIEQGLKYILDNLKLDNQKTQEIRQIDSMAFNKILNTGKPRGLFYTTENQLYIGIDNSTGEAWTEEFLSLEKCLEWLKNRS